MWLSGAGSPTQLAERRRAPRARRRSRPRARKIPLGRFGTAEEVAAVIVFLCSARATNVAGAAWSVDGGAVPTIL